MASQLQGLMARQKEFRASNQWIFGTMLVSSLVSLLAAFVLSVDAITLAKDSNAALSCNINTVISCGKVGVTWQASLFGFPNAYLGLICEPIVVTVAIAGLSGIKFPRPFMVCAQIGYLLGLFLAYWLFFASTFVIHALCPWCLLVTISTTGVFASLLRYNIREDNLFLPRRLQAFCERAIARDRDVQLIMLWFGALFAMEIIVYGPALFA